MTKERRYRPTGLSLSEQAIHLLRCNGTVALAEYYLGALPFVLGLLYFWSDMSRDPMALRHCAPAAAGLAVLFIWMKFWQVRFCRRLMCGLNHAAGEAWPLKRCLAVVCRQAFVQATGLLVLPLSFIVFLPWTYAFYQNVSILDDPEIRGTRQIVRKAGYQAVLWPIQNMLLFLVLVLFSLFVFLNIGMAIVMLPGLLKSVFGIDSVFSLSGYALLNTTFLSALAALTYLCMDPIFKAAYVLRCFHGVSRRNGDDLRARLKSLGAAVMVGIMVAGFCLHGSNAVARANAENQTDAWELVDETRESAQQWDDAIEDVLTQKRFSWRLPREIEADIEEEDGWLMTSIKWVLDGVRSLLKPVGKWIKDVLKWLVEKVFSDDKEKSAESGDWRGVIKAVFYLAGIALIVFLLFLAYRWWASGKGKRQEKTDKKPVYEVDLSDDSVTAADLPTDKWLAMARELMDQKAFRRALRAVYLSVLAMLADNSRLVIARHKSNLDYFRELERRAHAEPELLQVFNHCMRAFENAWYGMHAVGADQIETAFSNHKRIETLVRHAV